MARLWLDLRHGFRTIRRGRGVTSLAILAFALGIGVTTAVFTLFYGVLMKPLPFPDQDQLVLVYDVQPACATCPASYTKYIDWRTAATSFSAMGGSSTSLVVVTGAGDPERVPASPATWTLLDVFGIPAAHGRWFTEAEDQPGGPKVVVLAHGYWQRRFAGDPTAIGRSLTIGGEPHEIVGVTPATFTHRRADLFVPVQRAFDPTQRGNHFMQVYARMKPGVTIERAREEMAVLGDRLKTEFNHNHGINVASYYRAVVGGVEQPLRVLMGAVGLVLLIASANVANLLLAAGLARRRELAVRSALGATRGDLARQLTVESILLALAGGAIGLLLAHWAVGTFVGLAGTTLPRAATIGIDGWVAVFAAALSIAVGALCGLWPVARLRTRALSQAVRDSDLRSGTDVAGRRFGNGLVVVEMALAFSLLAGAGLLIKDLRGLEARETGFQSAGVLTFDVAPAGPRYRAPDQIRAFYRDLLPRLAAVPGVAAAGATSHLPMYQFGWNGEVTLEGGNPWEPESAPLIERAWVDPGYFTAMGIEIVRGRAFDDRDRAGAPGVTVISERAAGKFWPGQDPIGRRFARGGTFGDQSPISEVIGVARDVRTFGLAANAPFLMYVPMEQEPFGALTIVLRAAGGDPAALAPGARDVVRALDPALPVSRVQPMAFVVAQSVTQPRLVSSLAALFGVLAGALAAVGVYGVMAYNVRRARREFGIRLALGADPAGVRALILRRGAVLGTLGIALGVAGALVLTRTMASLLSDVAPNDPWVFGAAAALLFVVALAAILGPARQAARTDPIIALRAE